MIVKIGAIGDVVMTIPAAKQLHDQGFEIHWMCGGVVRPLVESYQWIHPFPVDEKALFTGSSAQRAWAMAEVWRKLPWRKFDLCATLNYDWRYRLLTLPLRADRKVALSRVNRKLRLLPGRSCTDEFARILLGWADQRRETELEPVLPDRLPKSPLPPKTAERRIALVPGGATNLHKQLVLRRWPMNSYVQLARTLLARNWEVVLLGGPGDEWVLEHFQGMRATNAIGCFSLTQVISVIQACDGVVSHDTGPTHLAGMCETPLVAIFGPTNPFHFLPRRRLVTGIWGGQGFACRPCHDGHSFAPCDFAGCMNQVSSTLVLRELDGLLSAHDLGIATPWRIVFPTPA